MTTKVDPLTVRVNIFIMAVDQNESERAKYVIYDDFKLKKSVVLHGLFKNMSALLWGTIQYPGGGGVRFLSRANYLFQPGSAAR